MNHPTQTSNSSLLQQQPVEKNTEDRANTTGKQIHVNVITVHTGKKHYCQYCQIMFPSRWTLWGHLRTTHTQERPRTCATCEKTFVEKKELEEHELTHSKERPYSCPHCDRTFSSNFSLWNHMSAQTGEGPYRCSGCPEVFEHECALRKHDSVFTGHKPFSCSTCQRTFAFRKALTRHKRSHREKKAEDFCLGRLGDLY